MIRILALCLVLAGCGGLPQRALDSTYTIIEEETGSGTAWVVGRTEWRTYFVTAAHVVHRRQPLYSVDGEKLPPWRIDGTAVAVEWMDRERDLALVSLVHIPADNWGRPLRLSRETPRVGSRAFAIGYTMHGDVTLQASGTITSVDWYGRLVHNAGIHPGMSGGPLVNARGEVIGVNVAAPGWGMGANATMGLAVTAQSIKEFLDECDVSFSY